MIVVQTKKARHKGSGWFFIMTAIAIAVILYYGFRPGRGNATLFFLSQDYTTFVRESRKLPLSGSVENRTEILIRELLLGPINNANKPLFWGGAVLRTVMDRNGMLHIDISIQDLAGQKVGMTLIRQAIVKSIIASIPGAPPIFLYADGYPIE
jgi:hypothetical protein